MAIVYTTWAITQPLNFKPRPCFPFSSSTGADGSWHISFTLHLEWLRAKNKEKVAAINIMPFFLSLSSSLSSFVLLHQCFCSCLMSFDHILLWFILPGLDASSVCWHVADGCPVCGLLSSRSRLHIKKWHLDHMTSNGVMWSEGACPFLIKKDVLILNSVQWFNSQLTSLYSLTFSNLIRGLSVMITVDIQNITTHGIWFWSANNMFLLY